jgi:predicted ATP-dependent endonuclease of OLD family
MKLYNLKIEGFKRVHSANVRFGDATFLIGANNAGKSSVLQAIEWLFSDKKRLEPDCFCSEIDEETNENKIVCKKVVLEAELRNVPEDAVNWRGFKGRIFNYNCEDINDTGKSIFYRKTYTLGEDVDIEIKTLTRTLKNNYNTTAELIAAGVDEEKVLDLFKDLKKSLQ